MHSLLRNNPHGKPAWAFHGAPGSVSGHGLPPSFVLMRVMPHDNPTHAITPVPSTPSTSHHQSNRCSHEERLEKNGITKGMKGEMSSDMANRMSTTLSCALVQSLTKSYPISLD